jgi:isopenicillin N synthase-like dioxygenase
LSNSALPLQVLAASSTWGFFFVTGHGIPKEHFSSVFNEAANFFEQPNSLKKSLHINNHEGFRGYTGIFEQGNYDTDETDPRAALMDSTENTGDSSGGVGEGAGPGNSLMDHKQVYHIGQELSREHPCYDATLFAPNVYPKADAGVPGFEVALRAHWGECMALSDDMFRIFAVHSTESLASRFLPLAFWSSGVMPSRSLLTRTDSNTCTYTQACLGLPLSHFEPLCDKGMNSMNTIHYPPLHPDATPDQPGIGAHTDFECFTLLAQREGAPSALEVTSQ